MKNVFLQGLTDNTKVPDAVDLVSKSGDTSSKRQ